jgi:hypothetical protein
MQGNSARVDIDRPEPFKSSEPRDDWYGRLRLHDGLTDDREDDQRVGIVYSHRGSVGCVELLTRVAKRGSIMHIATLRLTAIAVVAGTITIAGIAAASPAQAASCSYDKWGSNKYTGQRFNCSDGQSLTIRPPYGFSDRIPNSWDTWQGQDSRGNSYGCNYSKYVGWSCR